MSEPRPVSLQELGTAWWYYAEFSDGSRRSISYPELKRRYGIEPRQDMPVAPWEPPPRR
ncbi:hypothetical protein [Tsukamurella soli]|uniref:Uncharacterized protein n=1 Tax=Tsukamurella soli TaxID=644556 RepID=A0ABP8JJI1_9ACTN